MKFLISKNADFNAKDHPSAHYGSQRAGEDLAPCTPVTFRLDEQGRFRAFAAVTGDVVAGVSEPRKVKANQPVGIFGPHMRFHARDEADLEPGTYGLTGVPGEVDSEATTPIFMAVSKTDLMVIGMGF